MYSKLLKKCLTDDIYGSHHINSVVEANSYDVKNGTYWPKRAHTMIGYKRLNNIEYCINEVLKNNIPRDFIETGVWRGGSCIFMTGLNKYYNEGEKNICS